MSNSECIKVMIRVRPLNKKENERGNKSIVNVSENKNEITLTSPESKDILKTFSYDAIFTENDQ